MNLISILFLFFSSQAWATVDVGFGTSSVLSGRPAPSLALGADWGSWGVLYRSEGVQTTVYSQNAWMVAGQKFIHTEKFGFFSSTIGAGFGAAYILRTYRTSPTAETDQDGDNVIGPVLSIKFPISFFYFGFDTLLGVTSQIEEHITFNFQDVSHFTLGVSI